MNQVVSEHNCTLPLSATVGRSSARYFQDLFKNRWSHLGPLAYKEYPLLSENPNELPLPKAERTFFDSEVYLQIQTIQSPQLYPMSYYSEIKPIELHRTYSPASVFRTAGLGDIYYLGVKLLLFSRS